MSLVAIVGGTGNAGALTARAAQAAGHDVRVLSRHRPADPIVGVDYRTVDIVSGDALVSALAGADVLVDASNGATPKARRVFTEGARMLTDAAVTAGVPAAVLLSIAHTARSEAGYHRAKAAQEQIYRSSALPTTIVAATQFHDLPAMFFTPGARVGLVPSFRGVRFQPIDARDVADALVASLGAPSADTVILGGPEVLSMDEMARIWTAALAPKARVVPTPLPGGLGDFFRSGENLAPEHAVGRIRFSEWVEHARRLTLGVGARA